jgi:hypothetical protein
LWCEGIERALPSTASNKLGEVTIDLAKLLFRESFWRCSTRTLLL